MSGSSVVAGTVLLVLFFLAALLAVIAWLRSRKREAELEEQLTRHTESPARPGAREGVREQAGRATGQRDPARLDSRVIESIAHELRSPMTGIMGHQELLEEGLYGEMDEGCQQAVVRIGGGARQFLHLLDGTLDLIRIDGGALELQKEMVNGAEIARDAVAFAEALSAERGGQLETRVSEDLPRLMSDQARIVRTVHLTLTAAVRSAPGGDLRLRFESDDDGAIVLTVTGTDLPPDPPAGEQSGAPDAAEAARTELAAALAAARPSRSSGSSPEDSLETPALASSWLRLTIARTLARRLGGELRIETAGEGSRLTLRIPGAAADASASS